MTDESTMYGCNISALWTRDEYDENIMFTMFNAIFPRAIIGRKPKGN